MTDTTDVLDRVDGLDGPTTFAVRIKRRLNPFATPLVFGILASILGLNLLSFRPILDIDSSFRVGLTEALSSGMRFGHDIAWPFGPLGFLAAPTMLSRGQLVVALCYQLTLLALVLAAIAIQLRRAGVGRLTTVVTLVPFALALSITENLLSEFVAMAAVVLLAVWRQAESTRLSAVSPTFVSLAGGILVGVQLLVKFSTGFVMALAVVWAAATGIARFRNLAITCAAMLATALALWVATGQRLGDLPSWIVDSLDLAAGYQDAQSAGPDSKAMIVAGAALAIPLGIVAFGAYRWIKRAGRVAAWQVLLIAIVAWFVLKQGLIRWDRWHVLAALLLTALLTLAIPWERRFRLLPAVVLCTVSLAIIAGSPERLRSSWTNRADAAGVLLSPGRHSDEIAAGRAELRDIYALPDSVVAALEGRRVHAEQWDVGALWAYEFEWAPLPSFQTYSTYTTRMDELNSDRLSSSAGPDAVLLNTSTVDHRYGVWESPDARVALTCNFVEVAGEAPWFALVRTERHCGTPQALGSVRVAAGETISVPEPLDPTSLVVAHFELPADRLRQLVGLVARPLDYPSVTVDEETTYRLVLGTAAGAHLVRSPGLVGTDALPHGQIEHTRLSFDNVGGGDIVVVFEEIPLVSS